MSGERILDLLLAGVEPDQGRLLGIFRALRVDDSLLGVAAQRLAQLLPLARAMDCLHALFQADGNQQAQHNRAHVEEIALPGVDGFVGRVDIEHRSVLRELGWACRFGFRGGDGGLRFGRGSE
jgi:hypothetical protein